MYRIRITPTAKAQLAALDFGTQQRIASRIDKLAAEPEKQGKALHSTLSGFRSIRAAGGRYRIIYRVEKDHIIVVVLAIGIRRDDDRKDVHELMKKLLRSGLLE